MRLGVTMRWFRRRSSRKALAFSPSDDGSTFLGGLVPSDRERIGNDFESYVSDAFKKNGPVFACMHARQMVFSEAVFAFRERSGRILDAVHPELDLLHTPWPLGTTGELLARMIQDVDLSGNSWLTTCDDSRRYGRAATGPTRRIVRMRPDWVTMLIGSRSDPVAGNPWGLDAQVLGILYEPRVGGGAPSQDAVLLLPDEVSHFSPIPDPVARFRGMSWLTPIIREIESDSAAVTQKKSFFDHAAIPNLTVRFPEGTSKDDFNEFVEKYSATHQGAWNAYKTLFLLGGADVTPLTHSFREMDFSATVGKGEARIASAAGVPASWVGFSEGLQGSALNTANFAASRRRFADGTIRPLWRMAAASLAVFVQAPPGQQLWFDERDIAFLREDSKDRADIMRVQMNAIDSGIKSGFKPDSVVLAVLNDDVGLLVGEHTGLVSVQMQEPGDETEA